MDLSIIIPTVNEWPSVWYTVASIRDNIRDALDYQIIVVDNMSMQFMERKGHTINNIERFYEVPNVKVLHYPLERPLRPGEFWKTEDEFWRWGEKHYHWVEDRPNPELRLGHWGAKNAGIQEAQGDILMFVDAHVLFGNTSDGTPTIPAMYQEYMANHDGVGSLHLPQRQMGDKRNPSGCGQPLGYKLKFNKARGLLHYRFTDLRITDKTHRVPCMTTCHAMISKKILVDRLGAWPTALGIYQGGEHFFNFAQAVTGHTPSMWPFGRVYHYAEKRGYSWNWLDQQRNLMVATYIVAGEEWLNNHCADLKKERSADQGLSQTIDVLRENVLEQCKEHHDLIQRRRVMTIEDWYRTVDPVHIDEKVSEPQ